MNDDWRLRIDLMAHGPAHALAETLAGEELEHDLERSFHNRVIVSVDDSEVFCYTGSREQAQRAEQLVRRVAQKHGWEIHVDLQRWHRAAERWEDPDVPDEDRPEALRERVEQERAESAEQGYPEFEVRVECGSWARAGELSDHLANQGIPNLHRWTYLLIGAADEESARALARRIVDEAPTAERVTVERNQRAIYDNMPRSPFTVLGGLFG